MFHAINGSMKLFISLLVSYIAIPGEKNDQLKIYKKTQVTNAATKNIGTTITQGFKVLGIQIKSLFMAANIKLFFN